MEEVVKRYGRFDKLRYKIEKGEPTEIMACSGYFVEKENLNSSAPTPAQYYWICFDEKGMAKKVYIADS